MIRNESAQQAPSYSIARPAVDYDSVNPESGQEQVLLSQFDRVDKISENNTFRFVHASDPDKNFECQLVLDEQGVPQWVGLAFNHAHTIAAQFEQSDIKAHPEICLRLILN